MIQWFFHLIADLQVCLISSLIWMKRSTFIRLVFFLSDWGKMIKYESLWAKISQMITFLMKDCFFLRGFFTWAFFIYRRWILHCSSEAYFQFFSSQCKGSVSCNWQFRYFSPCWDEEEEEKEERGSVGRAGEPGGAETLRQDVQGWRVLQDELRFEAAPQQHVDPQQEGKRLGPGPRPGPGPGLNELSGQNRRSCSRSQIFWRRRVGDALVESLMCDMTKRSLSVWNSTREPSSVFDSSAPVFPQLHLILFRRKTHFILRATGFIPAKTSAKV